MIEVTATMAAIRPRVGSALENDWEPKADNSVDIARKPPAMPHAPKRGRKPAASAATVVTATSPSSCRNCDPW